MWPHRQQPTRLPRPWDSPGKNTGVGCHFLLQCMKVKSESEDAQFLHTLQSVFCLHCVSHYCDLISLFISLIVFLNLFPLGCLTYFAYEYIDQFLYWNRLSSLLICNKRSPHTPSFPCWSNVDCQILGAQLTLANQEVPCLAQVFQVDSHPPVVQSRPT